MCFSTCVWTSLAIDYRDRNFTYRHPYSTIMYISVLWGNGIILEPGDIEVIATPQLVCISLKM